MRNLLRLLLYGIVAVLLLCATLIFFGVGDAPEVDQQWSLSRADIVRAKKLLHEGSKTKPDQIGVLELSRADLNLAANYLLNRYTPGAVRISLKENKLKFNVTATLPKNHLGKYLNITFRLGNEGNDPIPTLTKFKVGKLLLPSKLAGFVIHKIIKHTALNEYFILATEPIQSVQIGADKIKITYHSNRAALSNARELLTRKPVVETEDDPYQKKLAEVVSKHDPEWRLSLAELIQPLFALAFERSILETAIEENKQVIFTINDYVNRKENARFISSTTLKDKTIRQYPTFLYKRVDLAQHFIGSAAITASANSQLAQMMGEEKELTDANGGSGFSFVDLTADKAGARFGEWATKSPESARQMQRALLGVKDYTAFMPDPSAFPEHMDEAEFKQRYGSTSSPKYRRVVTDINRKVASLPIYRTIPTK